MTSGQARSARLTAMLVLAVLVVTFAAPAPADAGALETVAIVGLVVVGVIVIVYLIAANVRGGRAEAVERWVVCSTDDPPCWTAAGVSPLAPPLLVPEPEGVQGP